MSCIWYRRCEFLCAKIHISCLKYESCCLIQKVVPFSLVLSVISTVVTAIFAFIVLRRWWKNPARIYWHGIGLFLYFVGTASQVILTFVWSPLFFALWYWCGALMVAAWLGQGTIFLLVRRGNIARNVMMALILVGIMTFPWTLFLTPFNASAWHPGADMTQIYRDEVAPDGTVIHQGIMAGSSKGTVRFFSPVMNVWEPSHQLVEPFTLPISSAARTLCVTVWSAIG